MKQRATWMRSCPGWWAVMSCVMCRRFGPLCAGLSSASSASVTETFPSPSLLPAPLHTHCNKAFMLPLSVAPAVLPHHYMYKSKSHAVVVSVDVCSSFIFSPVDIFMTSYILKLFFFFYISFNPLSFLWHFSRTRWSACRNKNILCIDMLW